MSRLTQAVDASDHVQGPADATVTLVEYGDYECSYCGDAYPQLKAVQQALGERLRFVFRNFPLTEAHPHALHAAEFAEAAASEGRFWEAHDLLYENQGALTDADLRACGEQLGLNAETVEAALNGANKAKIEKDFSSGIRSGVNGTPCLFINGMRWDGPADAETLIPTLEKLAGSQS